MSKNVIEFTIIAHDKFLGPMRKLNNQLFSLRSALVSLGIGAVAKSFVNAASKTEQLKVRLSVLLGSVREGNKLFQEMAKFAGQVPFEFEDVMESATTLAGIMKGGVNEVKQWMPIIGDLAATTGLSIKQTTEQVQRMLSAGAASADLFRERGVLAMLGFQAGVSYTAEETKRKLIDAWESPASKFAGATAKLATTWVGLMSMMSDKWFQFRNLVMDAGLFDFIKAFAIVVDESMGKSLEDAKNKAQAWSDAIINGSIKASKAVGVMANGFRGIDIIIKILTSAFYGFGIVVGNIALGIEYAFESVINGIISSINKMIAAMPSKIADKMGLRELQEVDFTSNLRGDLDEFNQKLRESNAELHELMMKELPSVAIEQYVEKVKEKYAELREAQKIAAEETTRAFVEPVKTFYDYLATEASAFMEKHKILVEDYAKGSFDILMKSAEGIGDAFGDAIANGKDLGKALQAVARQVLKEVISMLIKVAIQRMIGSKLAKLAATTTSMATNAANVSAAGSGAYAATAMIPIVGPALAPAAASTAIAGATAAAAAGKAAGAAIGGIAHGGMTNVPAESTYLLNRGERVLSPNQNQDLTRFMEGGGGNRIMVENLNVHILENATNADSILRMDDTEMREIVAGPIMKALDTLHDQGIRQRALERTRG